MTNLLDSILQIFHALIMFLYEMTSEIMYLSSDWLHHQSRLQEPEEQVLAEPTEPRVGSPGHHPYLIGAQAAGLRLVGTVSSAQLPWRHAD